MGSENDDQKDKPKEIAGTILPDDAFSAADLVLATGKGFLSRGNPELAKKLEELYVPTNSSTGVALRIFSLDAEEALDVSHDLLNLEQQAINKPRVLLRTFKESPAMKLKEIGLDAGRAKEEYGRTVVEHVLKRRDSTEIESTRSTKLSLQYIGSLFMVWFKSLI